MENQFTRTEMLFGTAALEKLSQSHVMVFGVGGVGSYVVEVLARSGVGEISLVDNDEVSLSNINRQLVALHSTLGQKKVEVARKRILDINPHCKVHAHALFYLPETAHEIDLSACDYVVDCIDTMAAKLEIIKQCDALHIPMIACMGAANKIDATRFKVADISKTQIQREKRLTDKGAGNNERWEPTVCRFPPFRMCFMRSAATIHAPNRNKLTSGPERRRRQRRQRRLPDPGTRHAA